MLLLVVFSCCVTPVGVGSVCCPGCVVGVVLFLFDLSNSVDFDNKDTLYSDNNYVMSADNLLMLHDYFEYAWHCRSGAA